VDARPICLLVLTILATGLKLNPKRNCANIYIFLWSHSARACTRTVFKEWWTSNSPDFNPLDYRIRKAMFTAFWKLHPKSKTASGLKVTMEKIRDRDNLSQVQSFRKVLRVHEVLVAA